MIFHFTNLHPWTTYLPDILRIHGQSTFSTSGELFEDGLVTVPFKDALSTHTTRLGLCLNHRDGFYRAPSIPRA